MTHQQYWTWRSKAQEKRIDAEIEKLAKVVEQAYKDAERNINEQIESWYIKFAEENGITMQAARKTLNKGELEDFKMSLEEYIKHGRELKTDPSWLAAMKNASAKHHIDRLTALEIETHAELMEAMAKWASAANVGLDKILTDSFLHKHFDIAQEIGTGKYINGADIRKLRIAASKAWSPDGIEFAKRPGINNAKLMQAVQRELANACIIGEPYDVMAMRVSDEIGIHIRSAQRIIRTEATHLSTLADRETYNDLEINKYQYIASLDNKTCDICGSMDLTVWNVDEMQEGVNAPPMHPNCRCATVPYYPDSLGTRAARDEEGKTVYVPENMSYEDWKALQEEATNEVNVVNKESPKVLQVIADNAKRLNVDFNAVQLWDVIPSEKEIIDLISGGDQTSGSCSSLAMTYIGNKAGYNVRDFRGGGSTDIFADGHIMAEIANLPGVASTILSGENQQSMANTLLKSLTVGKEYYLGAGKHAAIVRKTEDRYEYLELQSGNPLDNGFNKLTMDVLKQRFKCTKSRTLAGYKLTSKTILIDAESLYNSDEFKTILGYINTAAENQLKGISGYAK